MTMPRDDPLADRLDAWLADPAATLRRERAIDASPGAAWTALLEADLTAIPATRVAQRLKRLPGELVRWWQALDPPSERDRTVTFTWLAERGPFVELSSLPASALVLGALGRVRGANPGFRWIEPARFTTYTVPGHVKLAIGVELEGLGPDGEQGEAGEEREEGTRLTVEGRWLATDAGTARWLAWTWPLVRPLAGWWLDRCLDVIEDRAVSGAAGSTGTRRGSGSGGGTSAAGRLEPPDG